MIGRLLTHEELRAQFVRAPAETHEELSDLGWELTRAEIDALLETVPRLWCRVAQKLPSRLQRCSLRTK